MMSGSNWVPAFPASSASASSHEIIRRYGRLSVIASSASTTAKIRAPAGISARRGRPDSRCRPSARGVSGRRAGLRPGGAGAREELLADQRMALHLDALVGVEQALLEQDPIGDGDHPDVVEQEAPLEARVVGERRLDLEREAHRVGGRRARSARSTPKSRESSAALSAEQRLAVGVVLELVLALADLGQPLELVSLRASAEPTGDVAGSGRLPVERSSSVSSSSTSSGLRRYAVAPAAIARARPSLEPLITMIGVSFVFGFSRSRSQ